MPLNIAAGCNLQDELFASFEQIVALADKRGDPYARSAFAQTTSRENLTVERQQQIHGVPPAAYAAADCSSYYLL